MNDGIKDGFYTYDGFRYVNIGDDLIIKSCIDVKFIGKVINVNKNILSNIKNFNMVGELKDGDKKITIRLSNVSVVSYKNNTNSIPVCNEEVDEGVIEKYIELDYHYDEKECKIKRKVKKTYYEDGRLNNKVCTISTRMAKEDFYKYSEYFDGVNTDCTYIYAFCNNGIIFVPKKYKVYSGLNSTSVQGFNDKISKSFKFVLNEIQSKNNSKYFTDFKPFFMIRYTNYLKETLEICDKEISLILGNKSVSEKDKKSLIPLMIKFIELSKCYENIDYLWKNL